ncbi:MULTISPECIES: 4a-hydroxytetrahydrobiopterin dehydratase [Thioalkalivibrio]|jgi:pterin-4a-carbinolamine dehydratase|uniref:4a-hydroxytetrahydrobiopterin dehydratase n=1 Tax=Thioalkalivibrio TaxID=106633 RepID=UPI000195A861|nr:MULTISPECIES: 4a-hydroxytetrahydrobiopterin dehydratase [Thioalkalivibrio]ADC71383.1 transcriptional coactivator/pterin dehydratase [Thioalkalivibrio sp. K90mix]
MADSDLVVPAGWEPGKGSSATISKQFTFDRYGITREFLDRVAELSEEDGYHPNISFGTTYVNITIDARDGDRIGEADQRFAQEVDRLASETTG